jgi:HPt (histidine-containing phosphotransfer) domain-containing protein
MSFDHIGNLDGKQSASQLFPRNPGAAETLDVETLKALEKVPAEDGSNLLVELIDMFLESTPLRILSIRKAANEKDWFRLKHAVHTLKGSSSTLGLRQVAKVCQELEDAGSSGSRDGLETLVKRLENKFLSAQQSLAAERQKRMR